MPTKSKNFRLGQLGTLGQVIRALGKTIRAMACGAISTQDGVRICHGLSVLRTCFETQMLESIQARVNDIAERAVAEASERSRDRGGVLLIEHKEREPPLQ
jgi:hypothetical protein